MKTIEGASMQLAQLSHISEIVGAYHWWLQVPGVRNWWQREPAGYTDSLRAYVDSHIENNPASDDSKPIERAVSSNDD